MSAIYCHDVFMTSMNLSDIAISNINGTDFCCIIYRISKSKAINLLQKSDWKVKSGTL